MTEPAVSIKDVFGHIVTKGMEILRMRDVDVAMEWSISIPAVERWRQGLSGPGRGTSTLVMRYFADMVDPFHALNKGKSFPTEALKLRETYAAQVRLLIRLGESNALLAQEKFAQNVKDAMDLFGVTALELATEFSTSLPTVERWRTGENAPLMAMRVFVMEYLRDRARRHIVTQWGNT